MSNPDWKVVTKSDPCKICGHDHGCKESNDGAVALCLRVSQNAFKTSRDGGWFLHRLIEKPRADYTGKRAYTPAHKQASGSDWTAEHKRLQEAMTPERLAALAEATGLPAPAWEKLQPGWASKDDLQRLRAGGAGWAENFPDGAWAFPEYGGDGRIVGLSFRAADGRKGAPAGAKRGLTVPTDLHQRPDPVLIVEGASDVAALSAVGLAAVGRPSNRAGAEDAALMLDGRAVLVLGENDGKPGGAWPGRDGAKAVAQQLAARWDDDQQWALPPVDAKDVRAWVLAKIAGGLNASDEKAMHTAGAELLAALQAAVKKAKPEKRTQADALVDLAKQRYRLGISEDGEAFAVPVDGPAVAMMFRTGASGLRAALAKAYRQQTGKTPSASALADSLVALEGMAQDCPPEPVALRIARHDDGIVLDLGDATGRAVLVKPDGWAVKAVSPVLFRRTVLTSPLPEPVEAEPAALNDLRGLVNVGDDTWPLMAGLLVASTLPDVPHPVSMLGGEQGTGKSFAARLIIGLIDPSPAPLRSEPKDPEQWAIAASGSWIVCIDNVSHLSGWLSDAICKAVTGDGLVRRKLYTDSDLAVLNFRRCIILTSIDPGALRGDLADRLVLEDLERIPDDKRRTEADLYAAYHAMRPRLLGGLLSATAKTLAALPAVKLKTMPRMADFARVLAALDTACPELTGGRALELFAGQRQRIAGEVVESDAVALAIVNLLEMQSSWQGTAGELLAKLAPAHTPHGWPANGRALAGRLRRLRPALLSVGIEHNPPRPEDKMRMHRIEKGGHRPPEPPEPPNNGDSKAANSIFDVANSGGITPQPPEPPTDRPSENGNNDAPNAVLGGTGGMGGTTPATSTPPDDRQRGKI